MSTDNTSGLLTVQEGPPIRLFYTVNQALPLSPNRPVIILSNSLSSATWLWDDFSLAFSDSYTIVRYDSRFHGESPLSSAPNFDYERGHTIKDLASDIVKLIDHLGIQIAEAFIGLSIGGGVGVALAAQHAARFRHLLIVGSRAHATAGDEEVWNARITLAHKHGMKTLAQQSVERWFNSAWISSHREQAALIAKLVGQQSQEGYLANVAALRNLDLWPHVKSIKEHGDSGRVTFVVGEEDAEPVLAETKTMAEDTGSVVIVIEGAGHIVNVQQPEKFHELVRSVLEVKS